MTDQSAEPAGGTAAPPGIDPAGVLQWMLAHVGELRPPLAFQRIGHGQSNLTYRANDAGGRSWVLRRPPLGPLLPSAHDVAREYRIISALAPVGVPVPSTVGVCEDPQVTGGPFYVMQDVDGVVLKDMRAGREVSAQARAAAGRGLAETLAQIHAIDVAAAGLGDLARHEGYAERLIRRWSEQWRQTDGGERPIVLELAERLHAGIPEQTEVALVHGDYRLDNLILGPDGSVRAVLDWELSTLGDPLADLGLLLVYTTEAGDPSRPLGASATELPGFPTRAELVDLYAAASGRDVSAVPFWTALGAWKLAIVLEGVIARARRNPVNGSDGDRFAPAVEYLVRLAARTTQQAGL
ncbi:MAG TPA: phosphotransferase family protein [Solirubrobacteraceae bacterium]|nr:phosphotransferase family protein [Solirubrobacteraceae bacterium]